MLMIYKGKDIPTNSVLLPRIERGGIYDVKDVYTSRGKVYVNIYPNQLMIDLGTPSEFKMNWEPYK